MSVNTTRVTGRRSPRYETLDDLLVDAERLASTEVEMLGNWSLGQVFQHLAIAINGSIDGFSFRLSFLDILFNRLFLMKRVLTQGIPPGLERSRKWASVQPHETSVKEGLDALRAAVARLAKATKLSPHPRSVLRPDHRLCRTRALAGRRCHRVEPLRRSTGPGAGGGACVSPGARTGRCPVLS